MEYELSKLVSKETEKVLKVTVCVGSENKVKYVTDGLEITVSQSLLETDVRKVGEVIGENLCEYDGFSLEHSLSDSDLSLVLEDLILKLTPVNYYSKKYKLVEKCYVNCTNQEVLQTATKNAYAYNVVRKLNHLPHADVHPSFMAETVVELFKPYSDVKVTVLRKKEMEEQNIAGHLAVSQGSKHEPALIKIEYLTDPSLKKIGIVGKGMTFDMGGYNIKTQRDLRGMKKDMAGANGVVGAMLKMAQDKVKANVTAYLCVTDNLINENAYLPGDVICYKDGNSVEVINTDAEGRLVLADGIIMAQEDKNEIVIDICTLTGAIINAIGDSGSGLFTLDKKLAWDLEALTYPTSEKMYAMPMITEYDSKLDSDIADFAHIVVDGGRGSIVAALFLNRFVKSETKHIHIDMAAMADKLYLGQHANGYGTRLLPTLVNYLS